MERSGEEYYLDIKKFGFANFFSFADKIQWRDHV